MTHKGDTIRLKASFYTFAGVLSDPTTVTIKIYDEGKTLIKSGTPTRESAGIYYYDYTTVADGKMSFEFSGSLEGNAILSRDYFSVGW